MYIFSNFLSLQPILHKPGTISIGRSRNCSKVNSPQNFYIAWDSHAQRWKAAHYFLPGLGRFALLFSAAWAASSAVKTFM